MSLSIIAAVTLIIIGVAHSVLGEIALLQPLFEAEWEIKDVPRYAAEIIFRFAWHVTTIAWVALAAILLDIDPLVVIAVKSALSAAIMFFALRGHLSWPLFALISVACVLQLEILPSYIFTFTGFASITILAAIGVIHVYWAFGGEKGTNNVVPTEDGEPLFVPGPALTLLVAVLLFGAAVIIGVQLTNPSEATMWLCVAMGIVFSMRAVGDFKHFGFMKADHSSEFARMDDKLFTPVVVFLSLATLSIVCA